MKYSIAGFLVASFILGQPLLAQDTDESVVLHPFQSTAQESLPASTANSFLKLQSEDQAPSFSSRSEQILSKWRMSPRIQAQQKGLRSFSLYSRDRIQTLKYSFEIDGYPLCDYELKVHESLSGQISAIGRVPLMDVNREFSDEDWMTQEELLQFVQETFVLKGYSADFSIEKIHRCLWNSKGELEPAYEIDVANSTARFGIVIGSKQIYRFEPQIFHATGRISIFPNNELDTERRVFEVPNMKDAGNLENSFFITCLPSGNLSSNCPVYEGNTRLTYEAVRETSYNFSYDANTEYSKYAQTSIFTNANRTLSWLQEIGYGNFGSVPLRLAVHAAFDKDINNALYEPRPSYAMIYVGDGDNNVLQNLATDADVVSHELGHHVVYHTIKRIEGESLVLHEGLADYLTFARTGNACLGESICPDTSLGARICAVPKQCLRTAENNYTLTGADLPREAHQKSQFISGMLWDLTKKDEIPVNTAAFMVLKAIDLLVSNSGYRHFVIGLLLADNANFNGKYCETIRNRAILRGLGTYVSDVTCQKIKEEPSTGTVETYLGAATEVGSSTKESRKGKTSCGVIPGNANGGHNFFQLLLLIFPFITMLLRRILK